ncbi:hypothetical protein BT69DRAFT_147402 [Atractiella rhizophila]|nr:hypothetical protein BT69DRAFT_147402 [Atractiella rhizophila]
MGRDVRHLTFGQSLPVISTLTADEGFMDQIADMKSKQESLELQMIDERNRLWNELNSRGDPNISNKMTQCDLRFLSRWNDFRSSQQAELERLGVPTFFVTNDPPALEKQNKVLTAILVILDES